MSGNFNHVGCIIRAPDGAITYRHSRYPDTWGAEEAWVKISTEVRGDLSCGHELLALVADDRHEHPLAIIDGKFVAGEHMP